jgi:hypothetical protein
LNVEKEAMAKVGDKVLYRPTAGTGDCEATIIAAWPNGRVDIELAKHATGVGDPVRLKRIHLVDRGEFKRGCCTIPKLDDLI